MIEPDLSGRTALVTGSAKGVGRELLLSLAERGASVAVHYNTSPDAAEEVASAAREHDVEAVTVQGDVTDPSAVGELFSAVETDLGSVEILVNNVGAFAPTHWEAIDFETWNLVLETNLNGTYLCSKRALPGMRENDWGRIVNVGYASADRLLVAPKNFPYFVAKAGVVMFTRMLAADSQETDITVNAISPYVVENSDVFPEDLPRGRPASFEDMSQAMLVFLEDGSDYLSGQNLAVDGGWRPERV